MTSGQPPQPPAGGQQPEHVQQPPGGQPPYGQQPNGQPLPPLGNAPYAQQPYGRPPQYGQQPGYASPPYSQPQQAQPQHAQPQHAQPQYAQPQYAQPGGQPPGGPPLVRPPGGSGSAFSFDLKKLKMADYVIAGGTFLFFVLALLPWWRYGDDLFNYSLSGFDDGSVSSAFLLFLLATVWTMVPAVVDLRLSFPPAWITVGLAGLGFMLTLVAWIDSMSLSFQIWPLLGTLTAAAILLGAVLLLLPQLKNRPELPGSLAGAARWANQQAPDFGAAGQPGQVRPTYETPGSPPPPPPGGAGQLPGAPSSAPPAGSPSAPGGSTASGEGPGGTDRSTGA